MEKEEIQIKGHFEELFPTVVGFYELNQVDNLRICQHVKKLRGESQANIFQTNGNLHKDSELYDLNNAVTTCVKNYLDAHKYSYSKDNLYISNCWANESGNLACTHRSHIHRNTLISAVYFASVPPGSGKLYFPHNNLLAEMLRPESLELHPYNWLEYLVNPIPGLCVIFKSSTQHGVEQNHLNNNDTRISIAYTYNISDIGEGSKYAKS